MDEEFKAEVLRRLDRLEIEAGLKAKPKFESGWSPPDYSAQLAIPNEALQDMARAVPGGIDLRDRAGRFGGR
jgi:hypothetical protein